MFIMGECAVCLLAALFLVTLLLGVYGIFLVLKQGSSLLEQGAQKLMRGAIQLKGRWVAD
jgi:hypothetical protein